MPERRHDPARTVVVSHAGSGANRRHGVAAVQAAAEQAGMRHHLIEHLDALPGILGESSRAGDTLIVVNAGDGTACRVVELIRGGLYPAEPALALLRGGTTNMIHKDVGFPGPPARGLARLAACLAAGRSGLARRHPLRIRRSVGGDVHYGFFLGTNAALRATLRTRERLHARVSTGTLSELVSIAGMVWRLARRQVPDDPVLDPVAVAVSRNDGPWRETAQILLLAVAVRRALLGTHPLGRGQRAGLAVLDWPDYRLGPWLRRFLGGNLEELGSIALRGEFGWVLDGELHRHRAADGDLRIDVGDPVDFLVDGAAR